MLWRVQAFFFLPEQFLRDLIALFAAVVPGAKPFIERDETITAVVHLKILVVQIMSVSMTIEGRFISKFDFVETGMAKAFHGHK